MEGLERRFDSVSPCRGFFVSLDLRVNAALGRADRRPLPQVRVGTAREAAAADDPAAVGAPAGPAPKLCVGALCQGAVGAPPKVRIGAVPRDVVRSAKLQYALQGSCEILRRRLTAKDRRSALSSMQH